MQVMEIGRTGDLVFDELDDHTTLGDIRRRYRHNWTLGNHPPFDEWVERTKSLLFEMTDDARFTEITSPKELDYRVRDAENGSIETLNLRVHDTGEDGELDTRTEDFWRYVASVGETIYILPPKWTAVVLVGSYSIMFSYDRHRSNLAPNLLMQHLGVGDQQDLKTEEIVLRGFMREDMHASKIAFQIIDHYGLESRSR